MIKMPLGAEVGLGPGDIVLDGDQLPRPQKERRKLEAQQPPLFGPCLLWPNGWMDQDAVHHHSTATSQTDRTDNGPMAYTVKSW